MRKKRQLMVREEEHDLVPLQMVPEPFELDTEGLESSNHHRWLLTTSLAGLACLLVAGAFTLGFFGHNAKPGPASASVGGIDSDATVLAERDLNGGFAYPEVKQADLPYSQENTKVLDAEIKLVTDDGENITTITKSPPPEPVDETFKIAEGSDLAQEMMSRGVPKASAEALVAAIDGVLPAKDIKAGTEIDVTFDRQIDFYGREITFPVVVSFIQQGKGAVSVESDEDGQFVASLETGEDPQKTPPSAAVAVTQFHTNAKIGASLSAAAQDNKIPDYIMAEFTHVFSYDVDFQRQVSPSDTFEVFFGNPLSGSSSKRKVLHMARLTVDGETRTFFRFTTAEGETSYFDASGHSAARGLLRTPVSGAHLTSGFGVRVHPLLGYSKMHTGVDFGAPNGTPIHAAGDGDIEQAGRENGYGNTIIITHNEHTRTLYGHMSRFAAGIHDGVHVNQGQVIGYVGSTGRSTGPHLHFEVRVDDEPVNPLEVRNTGGTQLEGKDLANFRAQKEKLLAMMEKAPSPNAVAQAETP